MANEISTPCKFCGSMKVSYAHAPDGYVVYTCGFCGKSWK